MNALYAVGEKPIFHNTFFCQYTQVVCLCPQYKPLWFCMKTI